MMQEIVTTIACKYSCALCGVDRAVVDIATRGVEQSVRSWAEDTLCRALATDHSLRSPNCRAKSLSNVMIPIPDGVTRIGDGIEH